MNPSVERLIEKLRAEAALCSDPWKQVSAYLAVDNAVECTIREAKGRVLASALAWGGDGQNLAQRAHEATRALGNIGLFISEACESIRSDNSRDEGLQQVILAALANYGSSTRWAAMLRNSRVTPPYAAVHALYQRAERLNVALAPGRLVRDGETLALNAESYYLRNLLLPLLCHESLDPQQLEIVDSWLWGWLPEYRLTRQVLSSAPRLWVDLNGHGGISLRQFMPEGEDVRHLVVSRMSAHIRAATESFHAGRIPGSGCSATFPIDAHTGVLDHVQMLWDQIQNGAPKRRFDRFTRLEPLRVEGFVGLPEVLGTSNPRNGQPTRWMHIHDESEGGAAIVVDADLWDRVWHGDLIGIRGDSQSTPHVGVVVRKFSVEDRDFALGVEWIAREPRLLTMIDPTRETDSAAVPILYIPGEDESGSCDTIIVDERHFLNDTRYVLAFEDRVFEVRLNRLLRRGRGWVSAGYEIVAVRKREHGEMLAA